MRTASDILGIAEKNAGTLFPGDAASVRKAFRKLVTLWHPDKNRDVRAAEVFAHITVLKAAALRRAAGSASPARQVQERIYRSRAGKSYRFSYLASRPGDLGEVLVGQHSIAYETDEAFADVACAETARIGAFRFADGNMKKEMERFLPSQQAALEVDGKRLSILSKPSDTVLLADLIDHMGGRIPAVHAAWIVSGMMNVACYLHWAGLSHGAVSPTTVLVCPAFHSVILAGGWGFATEYGRRPAALPERTTSAMPRLALKGETADPKIDLQLVRATGQDTLGAPGGGGLAMDGGVPAAMKQWLVMPPLDDAMADYEGWMKCLEDSFGKRRFVDLGVNPSDVYGKRN